jgi:hypothetical protein
LRPIGEVLPAVLEKLIARTAANNPATGLYARDQLEAKTQKAARREQRRQELDE